MSLVKSTAKEAVIALAGNPNVGKSTVFNALTGMRQHTGNWAGKTVAVAEGAVTYNNINYRIIDLPGTYSLTARSEEESLASEFLRTGGYDCVVVVVDATCLERNLNLVLQIREITEKLVLCVNLCDEAKRKKIEIDGKKLSEMLGKTPVVFTSASKKQGLNKLMSAVENTAFGNAGREAFTLPDSASDTVVMCEKIARETVSYGNDNYNKRDRILDKILMGKITGIPVMLLFFALIFYITVIGANYPSRWLSDFLFSFEPVLYGILGFLPEGVRLALTEGMYRTLAWIVAVMLPPMAIFFPLFTLLEDLGYLPRIAFNLDCAFKKCGTCGKQALTMCMGFGCNAVGVTGCRIIDSPKERLIAMLTNVFVPCNGRFPILFTMGSVLVMLWGKNKFVLALIVTLTVVFSVVITLIASKIIAKTLLKGEESSFILELPPYRKPQVLKVLIRSVLDRTVFVLWRAVKVAAPAGLIIWCLANFNILPFITGFLNPLGRLMGMDGTVLTGFILGMPANEIVLPVIMMCRTAGKSLIETGGAEEMVHIFQSPVTVINIMIFTLMHFPCMTTLLTIKKECGSVKWTALAFILPTVMGIAVCIAVNAVYRLVM